LSPLAVVIADTHLPRRASALPEGLIPDLERADLILHAGDLMDPTLLDELAAYAPVLAVRGNLDPPGANLPERLQFEFGGVRIAMIHDSGPKKGRRNRMRRRFQRARWSSSGTRTFPGSRTRTGCYCSTPAARRTGGDSPSIRSRYSGWMAARYVRSCWRCEADGVWPREASRSTIIPPVAEDERRRSGSSDFLERRSYEPRLALRRALHVKSRLRQEPSPITSGGRSPYRRHDPFSYSCRVSPRASSESTCHALSL
jgi:Calcineurin-like phosphoesterase superfamily domain